MQIVACTRTHDHTATHCIKLQRTATRCNTLQSLTSCGSTHSSHRLRCYCCNTLQHAVTHCNTLHHTATHCNTLQHTATHCNTLPKVTLRSITRTAHEFRCCCCNTVQYTATHCYTLQHTATHCNTRQHTAAQCFILLRAASRVLRTGSAAAAAAATTRCAFIIHYPCINKMLINNKMH